MNDPHSTLDIRVIRETSDLVDLDDFASSMVDAIDLASDQDKSTVLTEYGTPVAAIVPFEVLEFCTQALGVRPVTPAPAAISALIIRSLIRDARNELSNVEAAVSQHDTKGACAAAEKARTAAHNLRDMLAPG